jgi:hypothetical protein
MDMGIGFLSQGETSKAHILYKDVESYEQRTLRIVPVRQFSELFDPFQVHCVIVS